jgi:Zn-dependent M16 (insulinase) family peptidase
MRVMAAGLGVLGVLAGGEATAAEPAPPGPQVLAAWPEGQRVAGHFVLRRIYLGPSGQPRGARFLHDSGLPVDLLFFPSAPRLSLIARTLPVSDRGESHTGEHLLLGKGRAGRTLNGLMGMRLGSHAAETHPDMVCYHFRAPVPPAEFFELTTAMLSALLRPDYTDEEIRREVAHVEAVPAAGGGLRLEEKGTVYNEMVSTTAQANSVIWRQVHRLGYGASHPLAREQGGLPEGIRRLTPAELRAFHAAHYHLGPNMALVAALPLDWSVQDFLQRLQAVFAAVEPQPPARTYPPLPPAHPTRAPQVWIGRFPSADTSSAQGVVLSWPPLAGLTLREEFRITLLLSVLAQGETSLLHRDLVDGKTRLLDTGATGVATYMDDGLLPLPTVAVGGLRLDAITRPALTRLRAQIEKRIRWLVDLPPGSPALAQIAERALSTLKAQRRGVLKSLDEAPGFGRGNSAAGWHRYLDTLDREGGFTAPLLPEANFAELERDLHPDLHPTPADRRGDPDLHPTPADRRGDPDLHPTPADRRGDPDLAGPANLWRPIAERAGLLGRPHVVAARPDPELQARQEAAREARLRRQVRALQTRFRQPTEAAALTSFKQAFDAATAAIEAGNADLHLPAFLAHPPLLRDDAPSVSGQLPGGVPVVRAHFDSTVFTDVTLAFDLRGVPAADYELLPMLASLDSLGVTTDKGEVLDYDATEDRVRASVYAVGMGLHVNPRTGRAELTLGGTASSSEEIDRLTGWIDTFLHRPRVDASVRARLVDLVRGRVQGLQSLFQRDADGWAASIASAVDYQDQPMYLAVSSPFTTLYHLSRLRWRLEDPEARPALLTRLDELSQPLAAGDRTALGKQVAALDGDLGEQLRFELDHLPPDTWQADLTRVLREMRADLAQPAATTIDRLRGLLARIRTRRGVRVQLTGSVANGDRAVRALAPLLAALPAGSPAPAATPAVAAAGLITARLRERYPREKIGVHLALVHDSRTAASHYIQVPGPDYLKPSPEAVQDLLTVGLFSGAGPSSLFMRTWGAGLAYGNGIAAYAASGRILYMAHRCPDPVETMRFVSDFTRAAKVDADQVQASLAYAFADYGGAESFSLRGARIAGDALDGVTPDLVRGFKTQLLEAARSPGAAERLAARVPQVLGRVLVGAGSSKVSAGPARVALLIAPTRLIDRYETHLRDLGETQLLPRLYPRDFWPLP